MEENKIGLKTIMRNLIVNCRQPMKINSILSLTSYQPIKWFVRSELIFNFFHWCTPFAPIFQNFDHVFQVKNFILEI
jgi:hypothetical protein